MLLFELKGYHAMRLLLLFQLPICPCNIRMRDKPCDIKPSWSNLNTLPQWVSPLYHASVFCPFFVLIVCVLDVPFFYI